LFAAAYGTRPDDKSHPRAAAKYVSARDCQQTCGAFGPGQTQKVTGISISTTIAGVGAVRGT
jgi:hypothetical protein